MHILALDDEQYALEALVEQLKIVFPDANIHEETKVSSAISFAENLAERGEALSFAFLDIQMRGMTGIEFAVRLKALYPSIVLFFCTAYSEYAIDAFGLCAKGYLLKPIQAKEIEKVLDEMVAGWRAPKDSLPQKIRIQTFGNFGVFVDDELLAVIKTVAETYNGLQEK